MAAGGKLEVNIEVKSNADKIWGIIRDFANVFPKVFPNHYKSIELVEGDGKAVGSVYHVITCGEGSPLTKSFMEKIEAVDDAKKTITFDVSGINGDVIQYCKKFKGHVSVTPKGDGSEVKWTAEYEKAAQEDPDPTILIELEIMTFQELDAYVQNAEVRCH